MTDLYAILGVAESATDDEIKKAYRGLAMQCHPDKNPGDKAAEEKFKTINDAYSTLGDPRKRSEYDQMRRYGGGQSRGGAGGGNPYGFHFNFSGPEAFDDIIRQFFDQNGFPGGQPFGQQQVRRNRDLQFGVDITLEEAFTGKDMPIGFESNGSKTNILVRIPQGIDTGTRMRFHGHGDKSVTNAPPGDLYVLINVINHPVFRRDGPHLHAELRIDAINAMVGCEKSFTCIDGEVVVITVKPGIQHGNVMRLAGKGMPSHQNSTQRGDLMLNVVVTVPTDLTAEHIDLLGNMARERSK